MLDPRRNKLGFTEPSPKGHSFTPANGTSAGGGRNLPLPRRTRSFAQCPETCPGSDRGTFEVSGSAESVRLCIQDDGIGFDSERGSSRQGLGIISMKERVRLVQGEFSIQSQTGKGTTVRVSIPLPRRSETQANTASR
jgi:hypothetical protein